MRLGLVRLFIFSSYSFHIHFYLNKTKKLKQKQKKYLFFREGKKGLTPPLPILPGGMASPGPKPSSAPTPGMIPASMSRPMTAAARSMLQDSQAIASSLVVADIVKKKYRNEEPRPAHLKPPLAESCFGEFPTSFHMRDTWGGNMTCRYRDRTPEKVRKAAKDPVSYLHRTIPKRMKKSLSKEILATTASMTKLMNSTSAGSPTRGGSPKKYEEKKGEDELPVHLRSNFNINGSSVIHEPPPRPLTA